MPRFLGQRVQLKAQLQGLTPAADRVRITATSRGIQYDIDARGVARALVTGFLGAQVRVTGTVWPARISPNGEPLGRLGLSSMARSACRSSRARSAGGDRRVLTTVDDVRRLDPRDAALAHQVKLRATVTLVDRPWNMLMIQDATAGIYVFVSQLEHPLPPCRPGDVVELEGESGPGEFAPMIVARRLTVVGHGPLPPARPTNMSRLLAGLEDSQLVEFDGVVRDITRDDQQHLIIGLSHDNQRFTTYVPSFGDAVAAGRPGRRRRDPRDGGRRGPLQHPAADGRRPALRPGRLADSHRPARARHRRAAAPDHLARARVLADGPPRSPDAHQGHRARRPAQRDLHPRRGRRPRGPPAGPGGADAGRHRRSGRLPAAGRLRSRRSRTPRSRRSAAPPCRRRTCCRARIC